MEIRYLLLLCFYITGNFVFGAQLLRVSLRRARLNFEKIGFITRKTKMVEYTSTSLEMDYYGIISLGTPPRQFRVVFDSSSPYFWVISTDCIEKYCSLHNKYNASLSSTKKLFDEPITINYQPNYVWGEIRGDVLTIGDKKIQGVNFLSVKGIAEPRYFTRRIDGILGLAALVSAHGLSSVLFSMVEQKIIDKKVFSVHLKKFEDTFRTVAAGEIIFGGSDPKLFVPPMNYVRLTSNDKYQIKLDSVDVEDSNYCEKKCVAVIDTSTAFIALPKIQLAALIRSAGAKPLGNKYEIPCDKINTLDRFSMVVDKFTFTLEGKDYVYKEVYGGKTRCVIGFLGTEFKVAGSASTYILGNVFIRKYYTEFDIEKQRVGFALAK